MKNAINKLVDSVSKVFAAKSGSKEIRIIHLDSVDSTNSYLMAYKPGDGEKITVVIADEQTAGRGQGSNHWESEPGKNLTFSILVHPSMVPLARQFLLSETGALAIYDVLGDILGKDDVRMKWPNDIYWKDKKLSGTLIETRVGGSHVKDCVFGVGINVNQKKFLSDAPNPVSMYQILGHETDLNQLLTKLLESFKKYYSALENGEYAAISELYHAGLYHAHGFHKYLDVKENKIFEAALVEVEDSGRLILRDKEGTISSYYFKEIVFSPSLQKDRQ